MRIGMDFGKQPGMAALQYCLDHGLQGALLRSPVCFSQGLDPLELRDARQFADEHGLYFELGIGRVNPFVFEMSPELTVLGGGDYAAGFRRAVSACREIGLTELWCVTGTYSDRYHGRAPWHEQLAATERFLSSIAPFLRDIGCRLNLETHEEVTTFELLRLIESVGDDVLGLCFDTANVLASAENPMRAAERVAQYVHHTHVKDAIVYFVRSGLERQVRPCGEGVVDWGHVLPLLHRHNPSLTLTLEDHKGLMVAQIFDPAWMASHADLSAAELASVVQMAHLCERRISEREIAEPAANEGIPFAEQQLARRDASIAHLRGVLAAAGLG